MSALMYGAVTSDSEAMWLDQLPTKHLIVDDLANCSRSEAAAAASASKTHYQGHSVSLHFFKQTLAILCWTVGLPG